MTYAGSRSEERPTFKADENEASPTTFGRNWRALPIVVGGCGEVEFEAESINDPAVELLSTSGERFAALRKRFDEFLTLNGLDPDLFSWESASKQEFLDMYKSRDNLTFPTFLVDVTTERTTPGFTSDYLHPASTATETRLSLLYIAKKGSDNTRPSNFPWLAAAKALGHELFTHAIPFLLGIRTKGEVIDLSSYSQKSFITYENPWSDFQIRKESLRSDDLEKGWFLDSAPKSALIQLIELSSR